MLVDVFFGKAGEEDAVKAGVESVEVGAAHVADTWLGLKKIKRGRVKTDYDLNQNSNAHLNFRKRFLLFPTEAAVKTSDASGDKHNMIIPHDMHVSISYFHFK